MNPLSPADMALLQAWRAYVRSHAPRPYRADYTKDSVNRTLLFYLMTEILVEHYSANDVSCSSYQALRMMHVDSGTFSRWRQKWQKIWLNVHLE